MDRRCQAACDICYLKGMQAHAELMTTETMGLPMLYCIGNHDLVAGDYGEQAFEDLFGPCRYSFNAGGIHFLVVPMTEGWDVERLQLQGFHLRTCPQHLYER